MNSYIAVNGQEITDEMIDRWCDAYERGEFPDGEHTVGEIVMGRPPLSSEGTVSLNIKVPAGMKVAIAKKAKKNGMTTSAYARGVLVDYLLAKEKS